MGQLEELEERIALHERDLEDLKVLRDDLLRKQTLECKLCKKTSLLEEWTFRQAVQYLGKWVNHDSQSLVACPCCGTYFRMLEQEKHAQKFLLGARALMQQGDVLMV